MIDEILGRKKGCWIDTDNYFYRWKCSKCGYHTRDAEPNYCPNCGVEMNRGEQRWQMSMYDNYEKDELFDLIKEFLEHHQVYELLKIVKDAVKEVEVW